MQKTNSQAVRNRRGKRRLVSARRRGSLRSRRAEFAHDVHTRAGTDAVRAFRAYCSSHQPQPTSKSSGIAVLLAEQNLRFITPLADRVYVLESGELRLEGTISAMAERQEVRALLAL